MSDDLISRSALLEKIGTSNYSSIDPYDQRGKIFKMVAMFPAVDAVSPSVVEQYKWERDVAIAQLEELGIGFGQKKPDMVEVVRCKDCKAFGKSPWGHFPKGWCKIHGRHRDPDYYCASGVRKDAEVEG